MTAINERTYVSRAIKKLVEGSKTVVCTYGNVTAGEWVSYMLTREPAFAATLTADLIKRMAEIDAHSVDCRKCTGLRGAHRHVEMYIASMYGR